MSRSSDRLRSPGEGPRQARPKTQETTMPKYLLLKHYRGGPAPHRPVPPMDQWAPEDVEAHMAFLKHVSELLEENGEYVDAQALTPARTAGTPSAATCTSWAATSLPPPRRTPRPPAGPRTSPSATTWSARPPARGPPGYAGTVVSPSVLHRLAYPAMTRSSRATHRWSLQANGRCVPTSRSATERRCSWGRRVATAERTTIQRMEHAGSSAVASASVSDCTNLAQVGTAASRRPR